MNRSRRWVLWRDGWRLLLLIPLGAGLLYAGCGYLDWRTGLEELAALTAELESGSALEAELLEEQLELLEAPIEEAAATLPPLRSMPAVLERVEALLSNGALSLNTLAINGQTPGDGYREVAFSAAWQGSGRQPGDMLLLLDSFPHLLLVDALSWNTDGDSYHLYIQGRLLFAAE